MDSKSKLWICPYRIEKQTFRSSFEAKLHFDN